MPTIVDIAVNNDSFQTLVQAVKVAELVDTLASEGPFTVFAPTDDAFAKLPPGTIDTLVQNPPQLARILTYHVISGCYKKADLANFNNLESVEGSALKFDVSEDFEVKNANVINADIEADNGVIHVIDNVLLMG